MDYLVETLFINFKQMKILGPQKEEMLGLLTPGWPWSTVTYFCARTHATLNHRAPARHCLQDEGSVFSAAGSRPVCSVTQQCPNPEGVTSLDYFLIHSTKRNTIYLIRLL